MNCKNPWSVSSYWTATQNVQKQHRHVDNSSTRALCRQPVAKQAFRSDNCKHRLPFLWAIHPQSKMYLGTSRKNLYRLDMTLPLSGLSNTHMGDLLHLQGPQELPSAYRSQILSISPPSVRKNCLMHFVKNAKWAILYSQLRKEAHRDQCISQNKIYEDMESSTTITFQTCITDAQASNYWHSNYLKCL